MYMELIASIGVNCENQSMTCCIMRGQSITGVTHIALSDANFTTGN